MERITTWNRKHVLLADALYAVIISIFFTLMAGTNDSNPGIIAYFDHTVMAFWSFVLMVPVAMRRWKPQMATLLFAGLVVVQLAFGPSMVYADLMAPWMLYSAIVYADPRNSKAFIVLAVAIGALASPVIIWSADAGPILNQGVPFDGLSPLKTCSGTYIYGLSGDCATTMTTDSAAIFIFIAVYLFAAIIVAYWQRARRITVSMMHERNDALQAKEDEERHIAALAERARIARDMHDVVAHTLSIIIIQSDGGRYAGANNPALARQTMETIRHESERALHDMKRLLGVFGGSDHADYADVDALIDQARAAAGMGCTIRKTVSGQPRVAALGAQASTAMYRMVQEALTNVRKYGGPNVTVQISEIWGADGLHVTVADNGRGASSSLDGHKPGYGLIGMCERIGAVGGSVTSGPQLGGGFVVSGFVPYSTVSTQSEAAAPASESPNVASSAAVSSGAAIMPMAAPTTGTVSMATDTGNTGVVSNVANAPQSAVASQVGVVQPADVTQPAGAKMPRPVSQMSSVPTQAPPAPITIRLRTILSALRSKPIQQASVTGKQRLNWIERMSQWTERHYLLTDLLLTILVAWMLLSINSSVIYTGGIYTEGLQPYNRFDRALTIIILIPLIFRRRFPESSALAVAILAALQLLFFEPVGLVDILASLVTLYSAVLYGRDKAWRWTGIAALADSALFGCKIFAAQTGYRSIFSMLSQSRPAYSLAATPAAFASAIMFMVISLALCISATAMARWSRSSGSNALVLQAREEALRAEQAKQRILAANMERDRISESIQSEVTMTLTSVIDQAVAGLRMLDDCERHGEQPSPGAISEAFAAIGSQGRAALAHMRKLLGVLRETGSSDEAHRQEQPGMQLRPAASLDKQLHDSQLHGIAS